MKLELKHIAAYLPYGVEIYQPDAEGRNTFTLDPEGLRIMEVEGFERFKPVLRSLDTMTNREKVLVELSFVEATPVQSIPDMNHPDLWRQDIAMYEWLLANHFDIFGLIDAGLAVEKEVSHD